MILQVLMISVFLFLGIIAGKLSTFLKLPLLLVFLLIGMLAGENGIGRIQFDDIEQANLIGTVAFTFILFSGGFDTSWPDVRKIFAPGLILASLGVFLTAILLGVAAHYLLNYSWNESFLLGSIISSTDAAAVFAIFRSKSQSLKGHLKPLLEFESGSNDPMAVFLTLFLIAQVLNTGGSWFSIIPWFLIKMSLGILFGYVIARISVYFFNRLNLEYEGLYYVMGIAIVLFAYSFTELVHGNGFMAVYVCGLTMGNYRFIFQNGFARFNDGLSWLMQVTIFLMLGLLVTPVKLLQNWQEGILLGIILLLLVRPIVVWICLIGSKFTSKEKLLISWGGLRGAAPIVIATFPIMAGVPDGNKMFHIVFFIVILSIFFQGKTLMPLARILQLDRKLANKIRAPLEFEETGHSSDRIHEYPIKKRSCLIGQTIVELGLPSGVLILLIRRKNEFIIPDGKTEIFTGDDLILFYNDELFPQIKDQLTAIHEKEAIAEN